MSLLGGGFQSKGLSRIGGESPKKTGRSSTVQSPNGRKMLTNKAATSKNGMMSVGFGQAAANA